MVPGRERVVHVRPIRGVVEKGPPTQRNFRAEARDIVRGAHRPLFLFATCALLKVL